MPHTHAYIAILNGKCEAAAVDTGDARTARDVSSFNVRGCTIERVTIEVARRALFEIWPLPVEVAP